MGDYPMPSTHEEHSKQKEPFNFNHSVIQLFSLFKKTDPPKEDALDSLFLMPFRYTLEGYRTNATVRTKYDPYARTSLL